VQLIFSDKAPYATMLSTLYALLRAASLVLDIESTDVSGCLYASNIKMQYSIILYDRVPGGAGHVHRISSDEDVFQSVIQRAYILCRDCDCSPSCYKCLRDYYNQKDHNILNRKAVVDFLSPYLK
jgi:ATP-dependent helicase YprA (DUF1998 family)